MSYKSNWGRTHGDTNPDGQLFDPATVAPKVCPACGVTDPAECEHDLELIHAVDRPPRRPRGCLHEYDPATSTFPF